MNQIRMIRVSTGKISASYGGNKKLVWKRFSYQVPSMVGTSASTNKKKKFYNSTEQDISREGGDCATNFGYLRSRCFYMG